ncbi:tsukushin [Rhinatrema bivittatum]|uniref:tsukushin n=1 Tax=Rhinatrema bivittatum TaxID=194408 RepID=UPI00112663BE|nr:tsukushin [Rhinatrema bivittatum]XP_029458024.1 tsukushin [Rhinatrema bivittatum]XP_029458025.1 tsukushin [Rhinatrema bivittatum]
MSLSVWMYLLPLIPFIGTIKACFPGCHCEVETFGLFDSFSLTKVDCSGVGSDIVPVLIPLDTSYLDLSSNQLEMINESVLSGPGYTTLVSLDLSDNRITRFSYTTFSKLRYLESLDLSHNYLEILPDESFSSSPLGEVDLSNNNLLEIKLDVFASKGQGKPMTVDLSNNLISTVSRNPERKIPNIQSLTLSGNRLTSVPNLQGLPLRYLNLDGNPISRIKNQAFAGLQDLIHLSLSNLNQLTDIFPYSFKELPTLLVLDLSNNPRLTALSAEVFWGLNSLQELNLSSTSVASLSKDVLNYLPSIKSITWGKNVHCLKTVKEGQFHRQGGQTRKEVLNCHDEHGVVTAPYVL